MFILPQEHLTQNQTNCDAVIGSANYDIAHVWGYEGGSGGGIASSPALCNNATKAQGVSGEGDLTQYAQVFFDQLVFHEMGHQFGMSHSYNSSIPVCTTRNGPTSIEPGAGATVMSYGFTCGSDDYFTTPPPSTGPILQFHTISYSQAIAYMGTVSCGTTTATGNIPPVVVMPSNYTIPKSTPFALTGSATDGNGDALTYCWEGTNIGTITPDATTISNTAQPPFSRSYSPVTTTTRTYPLLSAILDGSNYAKGDKLSSVGIATTHRLTVRDNNAAGGGVTFGSVTVTVDGSIGPFLETANLAGSYAGGSLQTITWSVNGTAAATPAVKISFSSDGGLTFPTTLLASTSNDGSEAVTLPNVSTTTARIKVEAVGNIFFDISNSNFTITSTLPVHLSEFYVSLQGKKDALLKWTTASENKTKGYEIEMANDNASYLKMGFVAGRGTTSQASSYQFIVPDLLPGTYYFRLKILDVDGNYTYSPVMTLKIFNDNEFVQVYPNPSKDGWFKLELQGFTNQKLNVKIVNSIGQLISNTDYSNYISPLNIKVAGGAGVYYFEITPDNSTTVFKKVISLK